MRVRVCCYSYVRSLTVILACHVITQVEDESRGQHRLLISRSRAVKASALQDMSSLNDIDTCVFLGMSCILIYDVCNIWKLC